MANDLFTSNAQYGNAAAPNTIGTAAGSFDGRTPGASYTPGSGILNAVSSLASNVNPTGLIGGALNLIGGISQRAFERREAEKQREWNEQMMRQQNEWSLEQWNRTNEYNTPAAQRQRLLDAGLNPMYYGLDGNGNAGAFESAQALGYNRASASGIENPLAGAFEGYMQSAQLELTKAQADKVRSETDSTFLDNEFKTRTMETRIEAEKLANSMSKEQIAKINDERKQIAENIKKVIAETDNEVLKGALIQAQTNVQEMQAKEIAELLPYHKLLMEAQTDAQRAQASLAMANAAIQKGLLDGGYVDKMLSDLEATIRQKSSAADAQDAVARLNQIRANMKTGNWYPTDTDSAVLNAINKFGNEFISTVSTLGDLVTAPISNIF